MFGKSKDAPSTARPPRGATANGAALSIIAADMRIAGNIQAEGEIHLDGQLDGDIVCATLLQGEGSRITGSVTATTVTLRGMVEGTVTAKTVHLARTARIEGDLFHESVTIEAGARVDGRMSSTLPVAKQDDTTPQPLELSAAFGDEVPAPANA